MILLAASLASAFIYFTPPKDFHREAPCQTGHVINAHKSIVMRYYACEDDYDRWVETWRVNKLTKLVFRNSGAFEHYKTEWGIK